jgi:hypothetical protein
LSLLPVSIGFSTTAVQASTNSKVSFLDETSSHTSQNLGTVEESPQLIATYHKNCSYGYRNNSYGGHGGGHHNNNNHGGHGGGHNNHNQGYYNH